MIDDPAKRFVASLEHKMYMEWWVNLRLDDCKELVYRHAIHCDCGRTVSEAYLAWRAQNPEAANAHDELVALKIRTCE